MLGQEREHAPGRDQRAARLPDIRPDQLTAQSPRTETSLAPRQLPGARTKDFQENS